MIYYKHFFFSLVELCFFFSPFFWIIVFRATKYYIHFIRLKCFVQFRCRTPVYRHYPHIYQMFWSTLTGNDLQRTTDHYCETSSALNRKSLYFLVCLKLSYELGTKSTKNDWQFLKFHVTISAEKIIHVQGIYNMIRSNHPLPILQLIFLRHKGKRDFNFFFNVHCKSWTKSNITNLTFFYIWFEYLICSEYLSRYMFWNDFIRSDTFITNSKGYFLMKLDYKVSNASNIW